MKSITFTLLADGSSDRALLPILRWSMESMLKTVPVNEKFADFSLMPNPPRLQNLEVRIQCALDLYPCDLLFVHKDAEKEPVHKRITEVQAAINAIGHNGFVVPVVPVRMTEAWLMSDLSAIKKAAGNRNGKQAITLPSMKTIEGNPDPKNELLQILRDASGLNGRRLASFNDRHAIQLIAEYTTDFKALRLLSAFQDFETHLGKTLKGMGF